MQSKQIEELKEQTKILFKVVDKLENRISTLEKVLASHAKCIGEIREEKKDDNNCYLLKEIIKERI